MTKFSILITDDDEDDHYLLTEALNGHAHYEIIHLYDGQQLLDHLELRSADHKPPDLIILDINMPKSDGIATLMCIKKSSALKDIPILMYSTTIDQLQKDLCIRHGANGFVSKAWTDSELRAFAESIALALIGWRKDPCKPFVHNIYTTNT